MVQIYSALDSEVLKADRGYAGCLTHNPLEETHGAGKFQTHWGRSCGYSLDELAEPIPKGWRLPTAPSTETGRNSALFGSLLRWAGAELNCELPVLPMARATNAGFEIPLPDQEVSAISKSVERYRRSWIAKGRFFTEAERQAWGRSLGLLGGKVRRAANAQRDFRIIEGHEAGFSTRKLARLFKLSQNAIQNVIRRDGQGGPRTTQIVSLWASARGKTKTFLIGKELKTKDLRQTAAERWKTERQNPTQNPG